MSSYTHLTVIAFGDRDLLKKLDQQELEPPKIFCVKNYDENTRIISGFYKTNYPEDILETLVNQLNGLSMIIEVDGEPGFSALFYKAKNQDELSNIFAIDDYRDDKFYEDFDPSYLNNFEKIHLDRQLIEYMRETTTGCVYTNLLINPKCYI
jgi:hypothetical protein